MSRPLNDAYKNVRFRCPKLDCPPGFFIITAHNPDGITQDDARNEQADGALQAELRRLGHDFFPVTGGNADFSHAEPGYGVVCTREEALALAQMFRQDAVFEVQDGHVILVSALSPLHPDELIGRWSDLVLSRS